MNNFDLALCNHDAEYIKMFASYVMEHVPNVQIHIFTKPESFFADKKEFDLAIMDEEFVEIAEFKQVGKVRKKYTLTEDENQCCENQIFKYQAMDSIMSMIPEFEKQNDSLKGSTNESNNSRITAIYSPISHELQLPFSMAVGSYLKDYGKVLFLDLEEISILPALLGQKEDRNLSDLLYEISANSENLNIYSYIHQFMGFDYILPFAQPEEIGQIDEKTWQDLFEKLIALGYDNIVVLFGRAIRGFSDILAMSKKLYVLGKPGDYFKKGQDSFIQYIEKQNKDLTVESIVLPLSAANLTDGTYSIEELLQGKLGLFVKNELVVA